VSQQRIFIVEMLHFGALFEQNVSLYGLPRGHRTMSP